MRETDKEEVRFGLQLLIDGYDSTLSIDDPCPHCQIVDDILKYLDSKGVEIVNGRVNIEGWTEPLI